MYENLVNRLRKAAGPAIDFPDTLYDEAADAIEELTGFVQEAERDRDEYRERLDKANDAIEELQQTAKHYKGCSDDWYKEACDYKAMLPRWIPVTEKLPEERKAVIVWEPRYLNPYICVLSEGEWYVFGGYGVKVFGVTHWMPLPQPPKEET